MSFLHSRIFFRADGDSTIGLGHVVRSLALAGMLAEKFECFFLIRNPQPSIRQMISATCTVIDIESEAGKDIEEITSHVNKNDIVVLDGYSFDAGYQKTLRQFVKRLVVIDDEANNHQYGDMVINHASSALRYQKEDHTQLLLGPEYLLVRKQFLDAARQQRQVSGISSVFICMGGADPFNITLKVLEAVSNASSIDRVVLVTGSSYKFRDTLAPIVEAGNIEWHEDLDANGMVRLISSCELAITTASSVSLEICCVKAGLVVGTVAANQKNIHDQLVNNGAAVSVGDFISADAGFILQCLAGLNSVAKVSKMMENQAKLCDGRSAERLQEAFNILAHG